MIPGFITRRKSRGGLTKSELIAADVVVVRGTDSAAVASARITNSSVQLTPAAPKCVAEIRVLSLPVALKAPTTISATKTATSAPTIVERSAVGRWERSV